MNTKANRRGRLAGLGLLIAILSGGVGCEEGSVTYVEHVPRLAAEPPGCESATTLVEVAVTCCGGRALPGAAVELIVVMAPEARLFGYTGVDGRAWFEVTAPPEVTLVAYASAPGFVSNAGDIGACPGCDRLFIPVGLSPSP